MHVFEYYYFIVICVHFNVICIKMLNCNRLQMGRCQCACCATKPDSGFHVITF